MSEPLWILIGAVVSIALSLIAAEIHSEASTWSERILRQAAFKLPREERGRWLDEWEGELDILLERRSRLRTLLWARGILKFASQTADALCEIYVLEGAYDDVDLDLFGRTVLVAAGCRLTGSLRCRQLTVDGVVRGSIDAWRTVEINSCGVVHGNIRTNRLVLHDGAEFNGSVSDWQHSEADSD